ncbi:MAG: preprotein translocase subunit SecG [Burkholderiaceae bacterium]
MSWLNNLLMVVQVLSALGVIVLVLMQHGKGADMGAAFGSGSSGSLFGASGSANFLSRATAALATVFLVVTLVMALVANKRPEAPASIMEGVTTSPRAPALPADVPPASGAVGSTSAGSVPAAPASDVPK